MKRLARLALFGDGAAQKTAMALGVSNMEGQAYARRMIAELDAGSYVESVLLDYQPPQSADVYGVSNEDGGWYLKFYMEHGRVVITSCHPPEHALVTQNGEVITA